MLAVRSRANCERLKPEIQPTGAWPEGLTMPGGGNVRGLAVRTTVVDDEGTAELVSRLFSG